MFNKLCLSDRPLITRPCDVAHPSCYPLRPLTHGIECLGRHRWPRSICANATVVRADVPGCIRVAARKCSHPLAGPQLSPKELRHFALLTRAQIVGHGVRNGEEVIAVTNLVEGTVELTCSPPTVAFHIKKMINSLCQLLALGAQLVRAGALTLTI